MSRLTLPTKDPDEVLVITWDYADALDSGETLTSAATSASLLNGDGASPITLWGSPLIDGADVRQTISGGFSGHSYTLRCLATLSSGRVLALAATLPVRTA